jgi:hypothetical protein
MNDPRSKKKSKPGEISTEINTGGGAYIGGNVHTGGDFVGRDQNKVTVSGEISGGTLVVGDGNTVNTVKEASLKELSELVAKIHTLLPEAKLDDETLDVLEGDFKVIETQLAKPEPKKVLVLPKLKSIAEALGTAVVGGEAIRKLVPMIQQAITWAQQLLK